MLGYEQAFESVGIEPQIDPKTLIGIPLVKAMMNVCGDSVKAASAVEAFRAYYAVEGYKRCNLYPGVEEHLLYQSRQGRELHIVTAKPEVYTHGVLSYLGIDSYFTSVRGIALTDSGADKGNMLLRIIQEFGYTPSEVVMVGDRAQDILAAKFVGARSVATLYGYGGQQELKDSNPDAFAKDLKSLNDYLL